MNKFLKTTAACVAVLGCATGLVGCGSKGEESIAPDKAFDTVYQAMGNTLTGFVNGMGDSNANVVKNMLTIDIDYDYNLNYYNYDTKKTETETTSVGLKAILQTYWGDTHRMCAVLGLKNKNELEVLLNAYVKDTSGDEEYDILTPTSDSEQALANAAKFNAGIFVYKKIEGDTEDWVLVDDDEEYDATATYRIVTSDKFYAYLSCDLYKLNTFEFLTSETAPEGWGATTENRFYYAEEGDEPLALRVKPVKFYPEFTNYTTVYEHIGDEYTIVSDEPFDWQWNWASYYEKTTGDEYVLIDFSVDYEANKYYEATGVDIREGAEDSGMSSLFNSLYYSKSSYECDYVALLDGLLSSMGGDDSALLTEDDSTGVLSALTSMNFETFKALLTGEDGVCEWEFSGKRSDDKTTFSMAKKSVDVEENVTTEVRIDFIAHSNGNIEIVLKVGEEQVDGDGIVSSKGDMSLKVKLAYKKDFDEQYALSDEDLKDYGEAKDLNDIIADLIGGGSDDGGLIDLK